MAIDVRTGTQRVRNGPIVPRGCIALAHVPGLVCAEHRCPGCGVPVLLGTERASGYATAMERAADYDLDLPHP